MRSSLLPAVLFVIVSAAASVGGWWWFNRPVAVELSYDEPFPSVSFAPYRRGQSPLTKDYPPPEQIEEDLKSLVGVARGVRTYTAREGLDIVPPLAAKLGIEVTHSAWLGVEADTNELEVAALIRAANAHPDAIKRVIVGNEVLLRRDLSASKLAAYIRQVRAAVKQPVSYADVWAFWLKHPELADEVDFITIHILPYWEDEPVGVEQAAEHVVKIYRIIQQAFPGKPILIGESGWPTRGRNRGPAAVNVETAATFVRTLAKVSKENGFDYNLVEAFDQPWKARLEGTVGAKWGVVDSGRRPKFLMSGPVEANPDWPWHAGASALLGAAASLFFLWRTGAAGAGTAFAVAAIGQGLAALVVWQALAAYWTAFWIPGDIWAVARVVPHAALAALILKEVAGGGPSRWGERLHLLYASSAVIASFIILFNGRYRDIPNLEFLVPCLGLTALGLARMGLLGLAPAKAFAAGRLFSAGHPGGFGPAKAMAVALMASAAAGPLSEAVALFRGEDFQTMHPDLSQQVPLLLGIMAANTEMLVWSLMLLVMSLPFWAEHSEARRGA